MIDIELEIFRANKFNTNKQPNLEELYMKAVKKIKTNVHLVFEISNLETYREWVNLYPGLESKCEVIYVEELTNEGYR